MHTDRWFEKAIMFTELAHESIVKKRYDFASFSAQQAVEFCVKGMLIQRVGVKAYSHSLTGLLEALAATGIDIPLEVLKCVRTLGEHYLQARYPDARVDEYTIEEAKEAIHCMEVTLDFLSKVRSKS